MTLKILALRADSSGCALYRIWEPLKAVRAQYTEVQARDAEDLAVEASLDPRTGIYTVHEVKEDIDLLIVQRPIHNYGLSLIEQARRQGIATVVDIDDDLEEIHPQHMSFWNLQEDFNGPANSTWMRRAAEAADLVTVSTPALTKYAAGAVRVVPNYVPRRIFNVHRRLAPSGASVRIGWPGLVSTHPTDLLAVGDAISKIVSTEPARMVVVGTGDDVARQLGIKYVTATGTVPLRQYYQTLADTIDVGIAPLELNEFNRAKSYLKLLEMSALGIPCVASPTEENLRLHADGVGIIASSPAEWRWELTRLVRSSRLRRELGRKAREVVLAKYTYEAHADLWYDAWTSVVHARV